MDNKSPMQVIGGLIGKLIACCCCSIVVVLVLAITIKIIMAIYGWLF